MDEFVKQLSAGVGIDEATATKVVDWVTKNWDDIAKWLGHEKFDTAKDTVGDAFEDVKDKLGGLFKKD